MPATGMDIRGQGPNAGNGILYADGIAVGSGGVSAPKPIVNTTITFDPPSLTALATPATAFADSSAITIQGVALGDRIELFAPYDTQGVIATGRVTAANTIKIGVLNPTAGAIDLASGSWGVVVSRR